MSCFETNARSASSGQMGLEGLVSKQLTGPQQSARLLPPQPWSLQGGTHATAGVYRRNGGNAANALHSSGAGSKLGYVEGHNLILFRFSAEGHQERFGAVLQQAIDAAPDVLLCPGPVPAVLNSTTTAIPIVVVAGDPVAWGFTTSLGRPTGNITGVTIDGGQQIWGKRLSILKEAVEILKKPGFLSSTLSWDGPAGQAVRRAAKELGLSLVQAYLKADISSDSFAPAFEEAKTSGVDGLLVNDGAAGLIYRQTIIALAAQHRLPTIYPYREYVLDGGLLAYATDLSEVFRVAVGQIARLFGGAKPVDIPFVQPTKFQLVANVKAAQAIGLTLPPSLLLSADEVIE